MVTAILEYFNHPYISIIGYKNTAVIYSHLSTMSLTTTQIAKYGGGYNACVSSPTYNFLSIVDNTKHLLV